METVDLAAQAEHYRAREHTASQTSKAAFAVTGLAIVARAYYLLKGVPLSTASEEDFVGVTVFGGGVGVFWHGVAYNARAAAVTLEAEIETGHSLPTESQPPSIQE